MLKLRDYAAAENYCFVNSQSRDASYRKRLFHILLSVYLDPANELVLKSTVNIKKSGQPEKLL